MKELRATSECLAPGEGTTPGPSFYQTLETDAAKRPSDATAKTAFRLVDTRCVALLETRGGLNMQIEIQGCVLELVEGDVTLQEVDAIVNAANSRLAGGGGVDGAIHRRGGPSIMAETDREHPNGCPTGSAVISAAGNLTARHVIHAVGPIWHGGHRGEAELLARAYRRCLELAVEHQCRSIAVPSLSTGAYGYPIDQASEVALTATIAFLREHARPALVRFVLFGRDAYAAYAAAAQRMKVE